NAHDASGDLAIAAGEKPGVAGKSNGHGAAEANIEAAVNLKNPHPSRNGAVHADPRQEAILPAPCAAVDENLRATPDKAPLRGGWGGSEQRRSSPIVSHDAPDDAREHVGASHLSREGVPVEKASKYVNASCDGNKEKEDGAAGHTEHVQKHGAAVPAVTAEAVREGEAVGIAPSAAQGADLLVKPESTSTGGEKGPLHPSTPVPHTMPDDVRARVRMSRARYEQPPAGENVQGGSYLYLTNEMKGAVSEDEHNLVPQKTAVKAVKRGWGLLRLRGERSILRGLVYVITMPQKRRRSPNRMGPLL
ncbi:uncharacterized protein Tco025E_05210, partial [Trypanosoma conorhini]